MKIQKGCRTPNIRVPNSGELINIGWGSGIKNLILRRSKSVLWFSAVNYQLKRTKDKGEIDVRNGISEKPGQRVKRWDFFLKQWDVWFTLMNGIGTLYPFVHVGNNG